MRISSVPRNVNDSSGALSHGSNSLSGRSLVRGGRDPVIPEVKGLALINTIELNAPAQLWRDSQDRVQVRCGRYVAALDMELSSESPGGRPYFYLGAPQLFAQEDSAERGISVASITPSSRVRANVNSLGLESGKLISVTFGDAIFTHVHEHKITALSLSGNEDRVLFGDEVGGVWSAFIDSKGKFEVVKRFSVLSPNASKIVGLAAHPRVDGAMTDGGFFVEALELRRGLGPLDKTKMLGTNNPLDRCRKLTIVHEVSIPKIGSKNHANGDGFEAGFAISDFDYISPDLIVVAYSPRVASIMPGAGSDSLLGDLNGARRAGSGERTARMFRSPTGDGRNLASLNPFLAVYRRENPIN